MDAFNPTFIPVRFHFLLSRVNPSLCAAVGSEEGQGEPNFAKKGRSSLRSRKPSTFFDTSVLGFSPTTQLVQVESQRLGRISWRHPDSVVNPGLLQPPQRIHFSDLSLIK